VHPLLHEREHHDETGYSPIRPFHIADDCLATVVYVHMLDADKLVPAVPQAAKDFHLHGVSGQGRYTDDIILPRMAHAFVLRSPLAHAQLKRIDAAAAWRMSGVLFVATGADVRADSLGDVPCMVPLVSRDGKPRHDTPRPVLALSRVRHVGEPVALVVAETLTAARDAAEAIEVEHEPAAGGNRGQGRDRARCSAALRSHSRQHRVRLGQ
jgi:xanthine dehydrogenase molybdopterin-binding subunit B